MARRINKVVLYICNACQAVFNEGREAKQHWHTQHSASARGATGARRRGRPRSA